ncbi:hypothetical protein K504DRAFT_338168, partial [Pleomassaria siparia CBS 279.74]
HQARAACDTPTEMPPAGDATIPTTQQDRGSWVLRLKVAMLNTDNVTDSKTGQVYLNRSADPSRPFYKINEMEKVCWEMLTVATTIHTYGPVAIAFPCHDKMLQKKFEATQYYTFETRMNCMIELMACNKARCDKLMAGSILAELVAIPGEKSRSSKGNAGQNRKKQKTMEAGRAARAG